MGYLWITEQRSDALYLHRRASRLRSRCAQNHRVDEFSRPGSNEFLRFDKPPPARTKYSSLT